MGPMTPWALLLLILLSGVGWSQDRRPVDSWKWIMPLKTMKTDIEKKFGSSMDEDKTHPFQTYDMDFGRLTVVFAKERQRVDETSCTVEKGTVLNFSVSPRQLNLSELGYDLTVFKRDATSAPREIVYFSERLGILIDTKIVELADKTKVERVIMIEYHSPEDLICPSG